MSGADRELALRLLGCIDNTSLSGTDNEQSIEQFCRRTLALRDAVGCGVAAVCVYPAHVAVAKRVMEWSGIAVASVAGAFPHGQLPLPLKVAEVCQAVKDGADEVDIVLNRGLALAGQWDALRDEVAAMRHACQGKVLKVIVETCELLSTELIARATRAAIEGGADMVKTSTGKGSAGATLKGAEAMLRVVKEHQAATGRTVGFKAAGGIRRVDDALAFARLACDVMGEAYLDKPTFRIGASSLTENLCQVLMH